MGPPRDRAPWGLSRMNGSAGRRTRERKAGVSHEVLQALTILGDSGRVQSWKGREGGGTDGRIGPQAACVPGSPGCPA